MQHATAEQHAVQPKRAAVLPFPAHRPAQPAIEPIADLPQAIAELFVASDMMVPFERNSEIYGEAEPADYVHYLVAGTVRICRLMDDGRRQIETFHRPGTLFGFEAGTSHRFSAEAVTNVTVRLARRSALMALAGRDAEVAQALWGLACRELERAQEHVLLLGRKTAQERVASFLGELASDDAVDLPMSRQDMADYLGLTIETVSRTLTQLEANGVIAFRSPRRIVIRNRSALRRLDG